MRMSHIFVTIS